MVEEACSAIASLSGPKKRKKNYMGNFGERLRTGLLTPPLQRRLTSSTTSLFPSCNTHHVLTNDPAMNAALLGHIALPVGLGVASGFTYSIRDGETKRWYEALNKPSFTPPSWLFPPVWTGLYVSMGCAAYLVHREGGWERQALPLALYGTQLALNAAWSPLFFGAKKMGAALVDIGLLDVAVAACAYSFYQVNPNAGLLLLPYMGWICYATLLNYTIWANNRNKDKTF